MSDEPRNWLIYDQHSECYWGPNRGGYWKSIASAGLYTESEAKDTEAFAKRYGRQEIAVPLSRFGAEIRRLFGALAGSGEWQPRRLADAIEAYAEWYGGIHDDECPADDTCSCSCGWINDGVTGAVNYLRAIAGEE